MNTVQYTITHQEVIREAKSKFPEYNLSTALVMYLGVLQMIYKHSGDNGENGNVVYTKIRLVQLMLGTINSLYCLS